MIFNKNPRTSKSDLNVTVHMTEDELFELGLLTLRGRTMMQKQNEEIPNQFLEKAVAVANEVIDFASKNIPHDHSKNYWKI